MACLASAERLPIGRTLSPCATVISRWPRGSTRAMALESVCRRANWRNWLNTGWSIWIVMVVFPVGYALSTRETAKSYARFPSTPLIITKTRAQENIFPPPAGRCRAPARAKARAAFSPRRCAPPPSRRGAKARTSPPSSSMCVAIGARIWNPSGFDRQRQGSVRPFFDCTRLHAVAFDCNRQNKPTPPSFSALCASVPLCEFSPSAILPPTARTKPHPVASCRATAVPPFSAVRSPSFPASIPPYPPNTA